MIKPATRMNRVFLSCIICISWFLGTSQSRLGAQIDPRVLEDTADGKTAHFLVVFRQQLSQQSIGIGEITDDARAARLVNNLRSVSDETQQNVRDYLETQNIQYTSYWVANVMAVEGNRKVVEKLASYPEVELIEPDRSFTVDLEMADTGDEGLLGIQAPEGAESRLDTGTCTTGLGTGSDWSWNSLCGG